MEELKPCPFCGGEAELGEFLGVVPEIDENGAYIDAETEYYAWCYCTECGITTIDYDTDAEAIEAWNRRATDERIN